MTPETVLSAPNPPSVLRCDGTADFLATIPYLAGFTASDSLFLVLFRGRRAKNAIRLDLPESPGRATSDFLDALCGLVRETGLGEERPAIVIMCERGFAESGGPPWHRLAKQIRRRFAREGWSLREAAVIAPDGWAALLDPLEPMRRRSLDEIRRSPIGAEARERVGEPRPLGEVGALPEPEPRRAAAIVGALADLDRREADRRQMSETSDGPPGWLHGTARAAGECFDPASAPDPRLCARLLRATESAGGWLAVLLVAVTRPEFVIDLAERNDAVDFADPPVDAPSGWSIRRMLAAFSTVDPEAAKLRRAIAVLSDIAGHAPPARRTGILALLAWAWWMLGLQSVATPLIDQALEAAPEHELARMVGRLVSAPPAWSSRPAPAGSE